LSPTSKIEIIESNSQRELVTTVKKVKREVRDYEQGRMTPEKVKVWEFAPDCAYEITKYWGDSRVYHGCVKPPKPMAEG
jgi:hypothetical protein